MMLHKNLRTWLLAGLAGACAVTAAPALAVCAADGTASSGVCYKLRGSDTFFDVMTEAIRQARLDGTPAGSSDLATAAKDLFYMGTGSGNGETAMRTSTPGAVSSQSIAPMSRNFRPSIIDAASPDFKAATTTTNCTSGTGNDFCGHAAWAAVTGNVMGLDAAVFLVNSSIPLSNVSFASFVDSAPADFSATQKSVINRANIPAAFGNPGAFQNLHATVNYDSIMSVILSGVDGSGTLAACADPRRVQAVQDLSSLLGVTTVQHLYRRDDNSGTTDTFKDRIMVVNNIGTTATRYLRTGGRFCNGTAVGGISGANLQQGICSNNRAANCTADAQCGTGKCWFNLNNQDADPIRRPCVNSDPTTFAPTSCSDLSTGLPCQPEDGNANCTQGLVVALSDTDNGATDITNSIGKRIGADASAGYIGFAGREAALGTGAKAIAINTIRGTDTNVRNSNYLLARRLYIQNSFQPTIGGAVADVPTDTAAGGGPAGGADEITKEQLLWTSFLADRTKMDPIMRRFNFIRCDPTADGGDPSLLSNNLCSLEAFSPTVSAFGALMPNGMLSGNNGGIKPISHDGLLATVYTSGSRTTGWSEGHVCSVGSACTCSTTTPCIDGPLATATNTTTSGTPCFTSVYSYTGTTYNAPANVAAAGSCPVMPTRPTNAACFLDADCNAGLICADALSHGTPGESHSRYCCDPVTNAACRCDPTLHPGCTPAP